MSRYEEFVTYLRNHPNTRQPMATITDQDYQREVVHRYTDAYSISKDRMQDLKGGFTTDQLVRQMMLPEEKMLDVPFLPASKITKIDAATKNIYEERYGVMNSLTDKRYVVVDIDVDDVPFINTNRLPPKKWSTIDHQRVGHETKESIYFQPIPLRNIYSVVIDIYNRSEASQIVSYERNLLYPIGTILVTLLAFFVIPDISVLGIGAVIAGLFYFFVKQTKTNPPDSYFDQNRSIRLGVIDPESLKKSIWILTIAQSQQEPVEKIVDWARVLQSHIANFTTQEVSTVVVP